MQEVLLSTTESDYLSYINKLQEAEEKKEKNMH
jgi:hypothetical protein